MATRVCRYCKGKSEMSEMTSIKEGKTNKFFHEKCLKEYQEEQIFKAEQKVKRESLFEKIAEIYGIPLTEFPKPCFVFLENIRNGEEVFKGQKPTTRYKQGYDYDIIEKTYDYCRKDIEYHNRAKDFDSVYIAMRYGLRIIVDKISFVQRQSDKLLRQEFLLQEKVESDKSIDEFVSNYKKTEYKNDISNFLDD